MLVLIGLIVVWVWGFLFCKISRMLYIVFQSRLPEIHLHIKLVVCGTQPQRTSEHSLASLEGKSNSDILRLCTTDN